MKLELRNDEFELLGLKESERKILSAISKMAKTPAQISHHTGIHRNSIDYMLKKLEKKSYIVCMISGKKKLWKSDLHKILLYIHNLQKMKKK